MSMTLFVVVDGRRREPIKVTPMMKLSEAVDGMLAKIGKKSEAGGYALTLKRKQVDAALPVRFSGLQNRDTLDLTWTSTPSGSSGASTSRERPKATRLVPPPPALRDLVFCR